MRLLSLSDVITVLQPEIAAVQQAIFLNTTCLEDHCLLVGKMRGLEAAINAIRDEVHDGEDDKEI